MKKEVMFVRRVMLCFKDILSSTRKDDEVMDNVRIDLTEPKPDSDSNAESGSGSGSGS